MPAQDCAIVRTTPPPVTPPSMDSRLIIRDIRSDEGPQLGQLLVAVYSTLPGFPGPSEQPGYYDMLRGIGSFAERPATRVLAAVLPGGELAGGVVYIGDMAQYGSGGIATSIGRASGIRLLGVDPRFRGQGIGKALTCECIAIAKAAGQGEVVLHTTQAMRTAWAMYERLGFVRCEALDFMQQSLPVFGFRLAIR
jgi:GNAT superfamily N-acetyltransferase